LFTQPKKITYQFTAKIEQSIESSNAEVPFNLPLGFCTAKDFTLAFLLLFTVLITQPKKITYQFTAKIEHSIESSDAEVHAAVNVA
jgi:hypothetical protein